MFSSTLFAPCHLHLHLHLLNRQLVSSETPPLKNLRTLCVRRRVRLQAAQTVQVVRHGLALALLSLCAAAVPAALGAIPLWLTVLLHEGGTVLVCLNALRILRDTAPALPASSLPPPSPPPPPPPPPPPIRTDVADAPAPVVHVHASEAAGGCCGGATETPTEAAAPTVGPADTPTDGPVVCRDGGLVFRF
jgi:hypothetical protein